MATEQTGRSTPVTTTYQDQMGARVEVPTLPQRIVSLVPSQTELLFDLGVGDRVVGVTKFCTDPAEPLARVSRVGGTKNFNLARINALQPDLILGNKEENYQEGINTLKERYPVWMSDIYDLDDALVMIGQIASMVGAERVGQALKKDIDSAFATLRITDRPRRAAYFIWRKPYMVAGGNNFIDHLLQRCGLVNVFSEMARYPEVSADELKARRPDVLLLSSEPFPFTEDHRREMRELFPDADVALVDGTMFSWYGSRLTRTPGYLESIASKLCGSVPVEAV